MTLKKNADAFRDNEQIFLRSEIEKVVGKFLTLKKNKKIRELFQNLKYLKIAKAGALLNNYPTR